MFPSSSLKNSGRDFLRTPRHLDEIAVGEFREFRGLTQFMSDAAEWLIERGVESVASETHAAGRQSCR